MEVHLDAWQLANGAHTWTYSMVGLTGAGLRARPPTSSAMSAQRARAVIVMIDNTPPQVTINAPATTLKPTKTAGGDSPQVPLDGHRQRRHPGAK